MNLDDQNTSSSNNSKEMLLYLVNNKEYAISIADVDEIIYVDEVVGVPNSHKAIMGLSLVRNEVISIIDMSMVLDNVKQNSDKSKVTLKSKYLGKSLAFCIDEIIGIRKIEKADIDSSTELSSNLVISNIKLDGKIYMLLNYQKIVEDIKASN